MFTTLLVAGAMAIGGHGQGPSNIMFLGPHQTLLMERQCPGKNAYWNRMRVSRHDRRAHMQWTVDHTEKVWRFQAGGHLTFDGVTLDNHSGKEVTIKAWC